MPYYIHSEPIKLGDEFTISGDEFWHIKVNRRNKLGELLEIQDSGGNHFICKLIGSEKTSVVLRATTSIKKIEFSSQLNLYCGLLRDKALTFLLQKSSELNVAEINIALCDNSVKISGDLDHKINRWKKIIIEACKQCSRQTPPKLHYHKSLPQMSQAIAEKNINCLLLDKSSQSLSSISVKNLLPLGIIIGPAGGFSPSELASLQYPKASLGPFTLRAETAAIAAISYLQVKLFSSS